MNFKYIIKIQYDGTSFKGYGTQPNNNTIQDNLEKVLTMINSNQFVKTFAASRTDAKVHAYMQIVQFSLINEMDTNLLKAKLNRLLPKQINVYEVYQDYNDFINVRYDVKDKTYIYKIINKKSPFYLDYALYFNENLNIDNMIEASKYLIGEHDFTSFCNKNTDVISKVRTINYIKINKQKEQNIDIIYFEINGNGFLYNMVRLIVGTLLQVGIGKYNINKIKDILEQRQRTEDCIIAPPHGLYLKQINYIKDF